MCPLAPLFFLWKKEENWKTKRIRRKKRDGRIISLFIVLVPKKGKMVGKDKKGDQGNSRGNIHLTI